MNPPRRFRFGRQHRLSRARDYRTVFDARCRKGAGPITAYGQPNGRPHSRLGLSVNRGVGGAVTRNRIKRLLREAFRISQPGWPQAYDLVVVVRRHEPRSLGEYERLLNECMRRIHQEWERRRRRAGPSRPDSVEGANPMESNP